MGFFEVIENKPKKLKVKKNTDALKQVFNNYSYFGAEKHKFNQEIIKKYSNSNNPDDCLAVAISFLGEGADNRKNAIIYFEKYLLNPSSQQYFSNWFIFSSLANLNDAEILSTYGNEIFNKYKKVQTEANSLLESEQNNKLAINVNLNLRVVKNAKDAQLTFAVSKDAEDSVYIVDKIKDINTTYPYSQKNARELIMNNLKRKTIEINLHQSNFNLICNKYNLKNNEDYFYYHNLSKRYMCSQKLIDFVTNLLFENPQLIENIKLETKK